MLVLICFLSFAVAAVRMVDAHNSYSQVSNNETSKRASNSRRTNAQTFDSS